MEMRDNGETTRTFLFTPPSLPSGLKPIEKAVTLILKEIVEDEVNCVGNAPTLDPLRLFEDFESTSHNRSFNYVDPLQFDYPHYTPFQYAGNNPITMIDLDGCEAADPERKLSDKATVFYKQFGKDAIKALSNSSSQNTNKFKALYILAQRRMENSFNTEPLGNNPFNIKGQGDLGTVNLTTKEYIKGEATTLKQNFAKFSTIEKGFEGYLNLLKSNFSDAYKTLFDNTKTVSDFAEGLQKGRLGSFATDPDYKTKLTSFLQSVIKDYELMLNTEMDNNSQKIDVLSKKIGDLENPLSDKSQALQKRIDRLENENMRISTDKQQLQEFKKNEGFK
jgi:hypothetical protein